MAILYILLPFGILSPTPCGMYVTKKSLATLIWKSIRGRQFRVKVSTVSGEHFLSEKNMKKTKKT
jgi:hypothetical protein